ncbi:LytR/AlgR family response regulator transcription factor [Saccharicrinis sp. FJH54]|uniref:LytR/AlgR family response regulator transcription factor n=1 Tax=Saccharicrinis sp. FJH54 TaxID=3344665 RepID=UPI0035D4C1FC
MTTDANQTKIRALLVDDEYEANELLKTLIQNTGIAEVCGILTNPMDLDHQIQLLKPDILFLDIEMPGISGIEVLKKIRSVNLDLHVVYVTAFDEYMLDALRLNAFDYLLKPVDRKELYDTLNRIKPLIKRREEEGKFFYGKIKIPTSSGIELLDPSQIIYLQAEGTYTHVVLKDDKVIFSSFNLGRIKSEHLPANGFLQISRSYVVNVSYLKRVERHNLEIVLQGDQGKDINLKYSRNYLQNLL